MKAIRIQFDFLYQVPDDKAGDIYDFDLEFFHKIKEQMERWNEDEEEPRKLINAEIRHHLGEVVNEIDEEDTPLDGIAPTST